MDWFIILEMAIILIIFTIIFVIYQLKVKKENKTMVINSLFIYLSMFIVTAGIIVALATSTPSTSSNTSNKKASEYDEDHKKYKSDKWTDDEIEAGHELYEKIHEDDN